MPVTLAAYHATQFFFTTDVFDIRINQSYPSPPATPPRIKLTRTTLGSTVGAKRGPDTLSAPIFAFYLRSPTPSHTHPLNPSSFFVAPGSRNIAEPRVIASEHTVHPPPLNRTWVKEHRSTMCYCLGASRAHQLQRQLIKHKAVGEHCFCALQQLQSERRQQTDRDR